MSNNDNGSLVLRLCRLVAVLGAVAASLVFAAAASAVDDDPDKDPPPSAGPRISCSLRTRSEVAALRVLQAIAGGLAGGAVYTCSQWPSTSILSARARSSPGPQSMTSRWPSFA